MKANQLNIQKLSCLLVSLIFTIIIPAAAIAGSISGNVMDPLAEHPIAGLFIQIIDHSSGSWIGSASTDANGNYTYSGLSTGNYVVFARTSGTEYAYEFYNNVYSLNSASPVAVMQGEVTADINFSLGAGGSISGTVKETATNNPIENMRVYACDYDSGYCTSDDMTDSNGEYTVTGLAPGSYRIWVDCSNTNYVNEYYDGTYASNQATQVDVTEGQAVFGINFRLEEGGTITGVITESGSGNPLEGMRVEVKEYSADFTVGWATTQSDGSYTISGVPAGGHRVLAWDPQRNYFQVWYNNTIYWNSAAQVYVLQSQTTANIDFSLSPSGSISGTVTGSDSQPLADVWVTAYSAHCWNNWVGSCKTDANGNYSIAGLPPGKVYLFADATYQINRNYVNEWYNGGSGAPDCNTAMPITVVAEQNIAADFVLDHKFSAELVVKKVQKSDSSVVTAVEIMFGDTFAGTLPDDITTITLTGPGGILSSDIADFTYYPQWTEFYLEITPSR